MDKIKKAKCIDNYFAVLTLSMATVVLLIIVGIFLVLLINAYPALKEVGLINFIFGSDWIPHKDIYGAARPIIGTFLTTAIAIIIAVPLSLGSAIFITEICPKNLKTSISTAIELLAAIPSLIYGMWGLFVFASFSENYIQPVIENTLGILPFIGTFFIANSAGGINLFTSAIILAIMIMPFITSITKDTLELTPFMLKESAYGIGATRFEVIKDVMLPYSKIGIYGGIIIGLGRALGEAIAVAFLIGNRHGSLENIFSPYTTISSVLANEFREATNMHSSALFLLALVLFMGNFIILFFAKYLINKNKRK